MKIKELKAKVFKNGTSRVICVPKALNVDVGEYVKIELDSNSMRVSKYEN